MLTRLGRARNWAIAGAVLLTLGTSSSSQTRPGADLGPLDQAARALNLGRFDQVESLVSGSTDPRATTLLAEAHIQRGRYADAERLLTPRATAVPGSDAALMLGRLQLHLGRRDVGRRTLQRVLATSGQTTAADRVRLGVAARSLGQFQEANSYFRAADSAAPDSALVNIEWGELFLEKYERQEALKSFQAAIKAEPTNVRAALGLARVVGDEDPPAARKALEQVLTTNPNYVPAHLYVAELALDDRRRDDAREAVKKALAVNPSSLEAFAIDGAIAALEDRAEDFQARADAALKVNPGYGDFFRVAGSHLARNYRFDEGLVQTRRALALDPENVAARTDLGMTLLRLGDEAGAKRELEAAFKVDPFDVVKKNSLEMLDTLDKFVTVTDGNLTLRFHPDEAAVMREQALPLAKEALAALTRRWDFTPAGPLLIEIFPKHDDFAVRTMGLPGLVGALGVCFGKVVALDSPKARPPGQFSWEETLWHELAHVYTLQMSNQRVPRWLTEGISEWEETHAGRDWGRRMEVEFAQALESGKALKVKDLNDGFTNPELISLAYYEASILVDHLAQTYGDAALRALVRSFGRGIEMDAALKEAYNATVEQIQTSFDARLERQFGPIRKALKTPEVPEDADAAALRRFVEADPDSFVLRMRLGAALHKAGQASEAIAQFEKASELLPVATGGDNPNNFIATIALEQKDNARAIRALEAVVKIDHYDVEAARKLAALVATQNDVARTGAAYERVVALDPFDAQAQTMTGRAAMGRRDAPRALRAFRAALASAPADRASAHTDLAAAYLLGGDPVEAKRQALAALELAPTFERAQDLLLDIVDAR
ncbi:MAG: tetratricopeptide repeat protein [Vicinamibacterales bacterium]